VKNVPEQEARTYLEHRRWPDGPVCTGCGSVNRSRPTTSGESAKHAYRAGLYQCQACRARFTVTVGTVFEDSHVPLDQWLIALGLMCGSQAGITAVIIQRAMGFGAYRTAWRMCQRIRWALTEPPFRGLIPCIPRDENSRDRSPIRIPLTVDETVRALLQVQLAPRSLPHGERKQGAKLQRRAATRK